MASEAGETMEVAALGRPFSLGMLYDCRKDELVPGITLWDRGDLKKHVGERPQKYNEFEIVASESIEDKSSALNVEASLKASFLGGLVKVDGSAKYLNNSKTSKNQARVTLKYKATTKVQELLMDHLGPGNMKHPDVFEKGLATHVVTAILYGAQAFFVFDREVSQTEDQQHIEENLKLAIKKLPQIAIAGDGSLKMEEKEKASVENFSCSFFGDFSLEKTPTSFQEAVQVYQSLPKLLGANGENAVPMKVWLLPLTMLDSTAAKLVRQISEGLVQESQSVLEELSELEMRCNDALRTTTAQQFPQISKKMKTFKSRCSEFKLEFQQTLAKKLPSIRGGGEEEAVLTDVLRKIHSSPFNSENLNEWMDCKEREIDTLLSLTEMMKNTKVVTTENNLYKESRRTEHVVCFVFTSLGINEPYLSALSDYLRQKPENPEDPQTQDVEKEQWYASREVVKSTRKKAKLFSDFAEANQENKNIKFMAVGITNEKHKGSSIYVYEDGFLDNENFEPPSKPETVTVRDINHNSVTLKIDPPKFGSESVTSYSVEYCVSGEEGWKQQTASKPGEVTVGDLSPNTEYMIRCRAVTSVGVGPANQVSGSIKTLPCSTPGEPDVNVCTTKTKPLEDGFLDNENFKLPSKPETVTDRDVNYNSVTLKIDPPKFGSESVTSYSVEYCVSGEEGWKQQTASKPGEVTVGDLSPNTEYMIRCRAVTSVGVGPANQVSGSIKTLPCSTPGEPDVNVCTTKTKPLEDGFLDNENFELPSKPETVTVRDINHNSVTLKIDPPKFGSESVTSYSVEFCVSGEEGWKQQTASKPGEVTVGDLSPNTEYMIRCRAVTSVGVGPANQVSGSIKTLPCSPPGEPQMESNSSEISVSWKKPAELGQGVHILSYMVEYAETDKEEDLQWKQMTTRDEKTTISGLQSETEYVVRVRCDCGAADRSKESITVKVCTTKTKPLAELLKEKSKRIKDASPSVYKLSLEKEDMNIDGCRRFNFGRESRKLNRTIMLMGATGSGKSTLINGMINYIVGVNWNDDFRFTLIEEDESRSQAESQTSEVTVYKINHQEGFKIDYSVTIVDTPGFGDTRGIERDRAITEQLRNLFSSRRGVSEIDAVCFVAQASSARLTATQRYVFDSVLSIFGKDIAENIRVLVTFADGQRPPVLEAIKTADVPCPKTKGGLPSHFKFNNSALFAENKSPAADRKSDDDEEGNFDKMFWDMGTKSMKRFFDALTQIETKSLTLTKDVLKERKQIENSIEKLQEQVKFGLAKLEEIKETGEKLKEHEAEISRNENFEIEVTVPKPVKVDISGTGVYLTNCQQCHFTCHDRCAYADDKDKIKCCAMGPDGYCKVCPRKCIWNVHFNMKYRWEYEEVQEKQTIAELKKKYDIAKELKFPVEALIGKLNTEYKTVQGKIQELIQRSAKGLNRLKEIALKPDPLSTPDYIDTLIEEEKSKANPGWHKRVQSLMKMREQAEIVAKVNRGETPHESLDTDLDFNMGQTGNKSKQKRRTSTGECSVC